MQLFTLLSSGYTTQVWPLQPRPSVYGFKKSIGFHVDWDLEVIHILGMLQSVATRFCRLLKNNFPTIIRRKSAGENSCHDSNLCANASTYH